MPLPRPHLLLDLFLNSLYSISRNAGMVELVDAADSKSAARKSLWVQVPLPVPAKSSGYGKTWPLFVSLVYTQGTPAPKSTKNPRPVGAMRGGRVNSCLSSPCSLGYDVRRHPTACSRIFHAVSISVERFLNVCTLAVMFAA